jgi:hypothetical protein
VEPPGSRGKAKLTRAQTTRARIAATAEGEIDVRESHWVHHSIDAEGLGCSRHGDPEGERRENRVVREEPPASDASGENTNSDRHGRSPEWTSNAIID